MMKKLKVQSGLSSSFKLKRYHYLICSKEIVDN